jgi:hypothetical protein
MMINQSRMNAKKKYQRVIKVKNQIMTNLLQINKIFATQIEMENKITKMMTNKLGGTINKTTKGMTNKLGATINKIIKGMTNKLGATINKITKGMTNKIGTTINRITNKEMIHQKENN